MVCVSVVTNRKAFVFVPLSSLTINQPHPFSHSYPSAIEALQHLQPTSSLPVLVIGAGRNQDCEFPFTCQVQHKQCCWCSEPMFLATSLEVSTGLELCSQSSFGLTVFFFTMIKTWPICSGSQGLLWTVLCITYHYCQHHRRDQHPGTHFQPDVAWCE